MRSDSAAIRLFPIQILNRIPEIFAVRLGCFELCLPAFQAMVIPLSILHALRQRDVSVADKAVFPLRIRQRHAHDRAALFAATKLPTRRIRQMGNVFAPWAGGFDRHR